MPPLDWRRGCRSAVVGLQFAGLRMHTGPAHGLAGGTVRTRLHSALHPPVPAGPPRYLGAALANYVAARAFGDRTYTPVKFGKRREARTDGAGRKCGRLPAAGDWAGGVHRDVARAAGRSQRRGGAHQARPCGTSARFRPFSDAWVVSRQRFGVSPDQPASATNAPGFSKRATLDESWSRP